MVELACDWCGAAISRFPSQVFETNFCGRTCQGRYRSVHRTGPKSAHWKGGIRKDHRRVQWFMPWHHRADNKGYVFRYVIVAELGLGRPLKPGEVIHHLDGDPTNDHPDNLQVLTSQAEHARIHGLQRSTTQITRMREARKAS